MPTYADLYNTRRSITEDIDNTFASVYEVATLERNHDPDDELTDEDKTAVAEHLKSVIPELQSSLDELTGQKPTEPEETGPEDFTLTPEGVELMNAVREREERAKREDESFIDPEKLDACFTDDCVRIALNIPVPHGLSEELRANLEQRIVNAAAQAQTDWLVYVEGKEMDESEGEFDNLAGGLLSPSGKQFLSELEKPTEEEEEAIPAEVIEDIAKKWDETYEQMRPDYDEDFQALSIAVVECLIEDGFIMPGHHYDVETVNMDTYDGNKTSLVIGPKGSRTVKKENK